MHRGSADNMQFRILGPLEVAGDNQAVTLGGTSQRALLALLLLHANEVVSSDRLIDELWPGELPDAGATALQVRVSQLRKALGAAAERLETKGRATCFACGPTSSTSFASRGCSTKPRAPPPRLPRRSCARPSRSGADPLSPTSRTSPSRRRRSRAWRSSGSRPSSGGSR